MPRLRSVKTKEEAANVPADQAVDVILFDEPPPEPDAPVVEAKETPSEPKARRAQDVKLKPPKEEEPEPKEEPKEDVATLKQQLEALTKAEKAAQDRAAEASRRAEDAIKRQNELQGESYKHQEEAIQAQYDAIINALEASREAAESSQRELEQADINGDSKGRAEAYRKLARAEANMAKLEDGKVAYEARIQQDKERPRPQPQSTLDPLEQAIAPMPELIKGWLRAHPEYMTDQRKNAKMQAIHWDVMDEGHPFGSQAYIESAERHLGLREQPRSQTEVEIEDEPAPRQRTNVVTQAPPSRDNVSVATGKPQSNKVTLSPEERSLAQSLGLSEIEYARQKAKLHQEKANGRYVGSNQ